MVLQCVPCRSFIVGFSNNAPDPERDSAIIQEFFNNMEATFRAHPLWAGCSEEELESAGEVRHLHSIHGKLLCIATTRQSLNYLNSANSKQISTIVEFFQ